MTWLPIPRTGLLRDVEDLVLLPACLADQEGRPDRGRRGIEDRDNRRRRHASLGQIIAFELQYSRQIAGSQKAA
jgi:hypothetical protein